MERSLPGIATADDALCETLAIASFCDEAPLEGHLAALDWQLAGQLSRLIADGWVKRAFGELSLLCLDAGRSFRKVLHLGLGERARFSEARCLSACERILGSLSRVSGKSAALWVPGRTQGLIAPGRAYELVSECVLAKRSRVQLIVVEQQEDGPALERAREALTRRLRAEMISESLHE